MAVCPGYRLLWVAGIGFADLAADARLGSVGWGSPDEKPWLGFVAKWGAGFAIGRAGGICEKVLGAAAAAAGI